MKLREDGWSYENIGKKYGASPATIKKWWTRWIQSGRSLDGLTDEKFGPLNVFGKTPDKIRERIIELSKTGLGIYRIQAALAEQEDFAISTTTINNIIRGVTATEVKKKYTEGKNRAQVEAEIASLMERAKSFEEREQQLTKEVLLLKEALRDAAQTIYEKEMVILENKQNSVSYSRSSGVSADRLVAV